MVARGGAVIDAAFPGKRKRPRALQRKRRAGATARRNRDGFAADVRSKARRRKVHSPNGNTRGAYTDSGTPDAKATHGLRDCLRPWIPLQAEFRLLKKADKLSDTLTGALTQPEIDAMREAVGPLRVDWSFDEIGGTTIRVPEVDTGLYQKDRCRNKSALESALDQLKQGACARKGVDRSATYFNRPVAQGGIRPAAAAGTVLDLATASCRGRPRMTAPAKPPSQSRTAAWAKQLGRDNAGHEALIHLRPCPPGQRARRR